MSQAPFQMLVGLTLRLDVVEIVAATILKNPQTSSRFNRVCRNLLNRKYLKTGHFVQNQHSALGAGGPQFKSAYPDHLESSIYARRCPITK